MTPTQQAGVQVPALFGLPEAEAVARIQAAGLVAGGATYVTQEDLPPGVDITVVEVGSVLIQAPPAGSTVAPGTLVYIAVRAE
jgi:beta-lactam-binding protein with PASTA domain